ncbi:MAG: ATP-dependent Clp protease ATP-binding subunit [Victivallaceae bacterium]|nr:ATP-dependent Clp protease ATP-binding subunit [Victivallaceae bacterium]
MAKYEEPDFGNFTPRARQAVGLAGREAEKLNHEEIGTAHLLLGILALGEGVAVNVLNAMGINLPALRLEIEKCCASSGGAQVQGKRPFSRRAVKVFQLAAREAQSMNYNFVGTEHLLLAILREGESVVARMLKNLNVDPEAARRAVVKALDADYLPEENPADPDSAIPPGAPGDTCPALNAFGRNLTLLAERGELDPVIGRKEEIARVIQILCRRTKNNPVLIGEAGVGKTAILEGLAEAIARREVPEILADKQIYAIDLPLMVAGTKYRGQFEERIKAVIDEVRNSKKIILFIDELHTIVGAGGAEGAMDAANIIKPALSRGELQCVGATTLDEYRKSIEKDAALERRFQPVVVEPPSIADSILILKGLRETYEKHHHVRYTDDALESAVKLADRYVTGRLLPDKAIDVMDEAGAAARIAALVAPPDFSDVEKEIAEVVRAKEAAISDQDYERAARCRDRERELKKSIDLAMQKWHEKSAENVATVDAEAVAGIVSKLTGVPLQQISGAETKKLLDMEAHLRASVVGQDAAISAISRALRRSRADLKNPDRPIGSFIFLGPTGVGKTLLAKTLAEFIFGDRDALIQIDMSEYMEKFNVSRLVGSPPGYVGYGEGGELTERVRRRPYSVVLFDEIEKAHPDVMHILLQILEEGRITDTLGRKIDFRNTIIIMTSNVGAREIATGSTLGFGLTTALDQQRAADRLMSIAKKNFKPEFLNRIDEIVIFNQLDRAMLRAIVRIEVKKLAARLEKRHLTLEVSDAACDFLIGDRYETEFGARPIRRAIESRIEDPLSEKLLAGELTAAKTILIDVADGKLAIRTK